MPEQAGLLERLVEERLRGHRRRRDPQLLEPHHVVHTARRTGASIGEALHRQVAAVGDAADDLGVRGLGEDLLDDAERLGAVLAQPGLDPVEELVAAALGDVEQRDRRALERRRRGASGSGVRRRSSNGLTYSMRPPGRPSAWTCPSRGRGRPSSGPASPPAATNTMSPGPVPLGDQLVGVGAACTCGVVSPRRSSRAGLRNGREHRLAQPLLAPALGGEHRLVLGADDVDRRRAERPPVRAPRRGARPAEDLGQLLRARRAVVGDRQRRVAARPTRSTTSRREAALDVQRLPRAARLVLGEAEPELARVARASSGRARRASRRRSARRRAAAPGRSSGSPGSRDRARPCRCCTPIAAATGPLTIRAGPQGWVVTACPLRLNAGSSAASTAATTTGKYSGRQPASTAQAAIRSRVASPMPGGTSPSDASGSRPPSIASTRAGRRRDDGQPVAPPAVEHVLHLVRGAGALDQREHLVVVRRLRRASGLAPRRLVGDLGRRGAHHPARPRDERRQRGRVPADDGVRDRRVARRRGPSSAGSRARTRATCRTARAPRAPCP